MDRVADGLAPCDLGRPEWLWWVGRIGLLVSGDLGQPNCFWIQSTSVVFFFTVWGPLIFCLWRVSGFPSNLSVDKEQGLTCSIGLISCWGTCVFSGPEFVCFFLLGAGASSVYQNCMCVIPSACTLLHKDYNNYM